VEIKRVEQKTGELKLALERGSWAKENQKEKEQRREK
jgi:hypothetical protein